MVVVKELKKVFDNGFVALNRINLEIKRGEVLILKGVSGSGKSTLLSIIAGLDRPTSGAVVVEGVNIAKIPQKHLDLYRRDRVGILFQHFNLIEHLTVFENIVASTIPLKMDKNRRLEAVKEAMEIAQISHKASTPAFLLSGGEKQRCAIARALVNNPSLILFDEPTANLDIKNSLKLIERLAYLKSQGKTLLIATHDPLFDDLAFESRVVHLRDGEIDG